MNTDEFRLDLLIPTPRKHADGTRGWGPGQNIYRMEYEYTPAVRPLETSWVGKNFIKRVMRDQDAITSFFDQIKKYKNWFENITTNETDEAEPFWNNQWIPGADAAALYTLIAENKPATYLEVGSGNSTKFARRAVRDHNTGTKIISIDPMPRAEIDGICDHIVRLPVEQVDLEKISALLQPGDVVFVDNSHRSFQNSDVTVCCLDLFHAIPAGCYFGVHDIYLPYDYPSLFLDWFYNEQYLLMMYFLGGAVEDTIILPSYMATNGIAFAENLKTALDVSSIPDSHRGGGVLWIKKGDWSARTEQKL